MAEYRTLDQSAKILFETTLQKVQEQFVIKRKGPNIGLNLLTQFEQLKNYRSLYVHKVTEFEGKTGSFIILLIEKHITIIRQKRHYRVEDEIEEIEPILIFRIPQNIGKVFIRRETLADKITDKFLKIDIDFIEYPDFSKNYYVIGENPELVKNYLPKNLIASLNKFPDLTIEINGNWALIRTEKNLTEEVLLLLIRLGYQITK